MILPTILFYHERNERIHKALQGIEGYEYPTGIVSDSAMDLSDCIDDEEGTFDF